MIHNDKNARLFYVTAICLLHKASGYKPEV